MNKIFCKDSSNMKEIKDDSISLIITSPPYFDLKDYNSKRKSKNQIGSPNSYEDYLERLGKVWQECIRVLIPDGKLCINIMPIFLSGKETKFKRRVTKLVISDLERFMSSTQKMFTHALFIWDKRKIVRFSSFGSYPYPPNIFSTFPFEWIIVFSKIGKRPPVSKEAKRRSKLSTKEWQDWAVNSFWEMSPAKAKALQHPAPFPVELPSRLIKLFSFYGDTVLDPFIGVGTTAVAAKKLGRKFVGFDVNPDYVKTANRRIREKKSTGKKKQLIQK